VNPQDLRDAAFLLAPGFLTLKLFQHLGAQRERSEWEWTVWSVLVSLGIDLVTKDPAQKLAVAVGVGVALVIGWRYVGQQSSRATVWLRRALVDSAWDHTLDEAARAHNPVEILTENGRLFGRLRTFAREERGAEPWIYLTDVKQAPPDSDEWTALRRTEGVLIHRDQMRRLRVIRRQEAEPSASTGE
jgi:hypothetical protein